MLTTISSCPMRGGNSFHRRAERIRGARSVKRKLCCLVLFFPYGVEYRAGHTCFYIVLLVFLMNSSYF